MRDGEIILSDIPTKAYYDPEIFRKEAEQIFRRHWAFACLTTEVIKPGAYITANIGSDQIIVVRDNETVRAFHNVCPHRGAEIISGSGLVKKFTCPYHAWSYELDGSLLRAPGASRLGSNVELRQLKVETWGPFVFVCSDYDNVPPLANYFGELFEYFETKVDLDQIVSDGKMKEYRFEIEANWKVVVENSLECYHCSHAHSGLASSLDLRKFEQSANGWWNTQQVPQRIGGEQQGATLGTITQASAEESGFDTARFNFLFPNLYVSVWPGSEGFSTTEITPQGCHRTITRHRRFFQNETSQTEREESDAFIRQVINEDIVLCESVQRGLDRNVTNQRLMIRPEKSGADESCILHFHRLLKRELEISTLEHK
jgi:phenylpropionate dioxygenase-like ring-hydroxylating dioxygenase large terminal subunit